MKKQIANFESNALSRKEMKSLNGGDNCDGSRQCRLVIVGKGQQRMTLDGRCVWGGVMTGGCYCETGIGHTHISSNGGQSRCT